MAAAGCLLAAMLAGRPPARWMVRGRLGWRHAAGPALPDAFGRLRAPLALVVAVFLILTFAGGLAHVVVGLTATGVAAVVLRLRRRALRDAQRRQRRSDVAEAVDTLAAELGAGVLAPRALQHLAEDSPILRPAATAARLGTDVASAMRAVAVNPGAERLDDLAAAWEVSQRTGAPMARVLDRLGDGLRDERDVQREIDAGLGPAKATARLMAVLPLFGLGLGTGIGSSPVHVLFHTVPGSLCLAAGSALACMGVCWVDAIADRAAEA